MLESALLTQELFSLCNPEDLSQLKGQVEHMMPHEDKSNTSYENNLLLRRMHIFQN